MMNMKMSYALVPLSGILLLSAVGVCAAQTLVVNVEKDAGIRTDLDVRRNDNYGCEDELTIGTGRGGDNKPYGAADAMRGLLQFDLSASPTAGLASAFLKLTVKNFDNGLPTSVYTVDVHRIVDSGSRTPWNEGNGGNTPPPSFRTDCTGTDPASGVAWEGVDVNNETQPDFDLTVEASATVSQATDSTGSVIQWDVTPLVRNWLEGAYPNFGVMLRDVTTDNDFRGVRFRTREAEMFPNETPVLELTYAPMYSCVGFEPPLDDPSSPVLVRRNNRALPLKAQLIDADGNTVSDSDLDAAPVIQVTYQSDVPGDDPVDVSDDTVAVGLGTSDNRFEFTGSRWQYNLKLRQFSAAGTYTVTMVPGDSYLLDTQCSAKFVVQ